MNVLLILFVLLSYQFHFFQKLETIILDNNIKQAASHDPDPNIVVVGIDNESLEELGQFPWDRSIYAPFLEMLNQEGFEPAAIGFDITFSDASNEESDQIFAEALAMYDNVILPVVGVTSGDVFQTSTVYKGEYIQANQVYYPYEPLAQHSEHAHINRVDSLNGVIRQAWLKLQSEDGVVIPSLAYKAVQMTGADLSFYDQLTDRQKTSDPIAKNTITIDYDLVTDDFLTIPFVNVLYGDIPPETFKDAIVLVGATATGISGDSGQDSGPTPLERNAKLIYVHANIVNQLLQGSYVQYAPNLVEIILIILLFALFVWLPWRYKNQYTFIAMIAALLALYVAQWWSYMQWNYHISIVYALIAVIAAYLFNISLKAYMEQAQKSFVTRQFGRYISPDLVDEIVKKGMEIQLGGISKRITILFLDIRGFTSLSEKLTPAEVVDVLNTKFTMITNTALKFNGTIDKFIGDAAMILFNAPLDIEEHEKMAVLTAYHIQQNMIPIRQELLDKYGVEVNIGVGIHTGNVVIGNIGSYIRMDYTAIGDSVNIASRIESGTKGGQVLVSEETYHATKQLFEFGEGEQKMYKGKSQSIQIYELLGMKK